MKDYYLDKIKHNLDNAFYRKKQAWKIQDKAWQRLQALNLSSGPKIQKLTKEYNQLNIRQEESGKKASDSYKAKDHIRAQIYAEQNKDINERMAKLAEERNHLAVELLNVNNEHIRTRDEFRRTKAEYDAIKQNLSRLIKIAKEENQKQRDARKEIARQAGVPNQFIDSTWIEERSDGSVDIYFGSEHYIMDRDGNTRIDCEP